MSWQALEAVQDHSKINDHTALSIFYVLARYADAQGVIGTNGRLTSPSIDTIALKARCHRNTVLNWLPKIVESGELTIEHFGSGRGSWNKYTINLPMPEESNGTSQDVPITKVMVQEMVQEMGVMVQGALDEIKVMVQVMVHNGTSQDGLDTNDTKKEYIYNGVASEVTDELPANQKPEPSESRVQEMIGALSQVSKQKYIAERDNEFRPVAVKLVKDGFTVGDVAYFGVWWSKNRHYPGKPALKTIFDNIDRVIDERDNPTPAVNGAIKDDTSGIWVRVVNALSTRNYALLTDREKNAVRAVGIDRIKGRNNFTESQLRGEFFKALQGVTA